MSAELLREAAAEMRALAAVATPGPWRVGAEGSEGSRVNPDSGDKRERSRHIAAVNGRVQPQDGANARHIAAWHPDVADAVADWLDSEAELGTYRGGHHPAAVAVARTFLGRQS